MNGQLVIVQQQPLDKEIGKVTGVTQTTDGALLHVEYDHTVVDARGNPVTKLDVLARNVRFV